MTPGQVIAVVGPSGVGKDTVMAGLAAADPTLKLARRTITRAPDLGGEDYDHLSEAAFMQKAQDGAFCLHWKAHGLHHGIPRAIQNEARARQSCLVNLSRTALTKADTVFPNCTVLSLTARPDTLAKRLQGRRRETLDDIAARLAREGTRIPNDLSAIEVSNDGPLCETIETALTALQRTPGQIHAHMCE